MRRDPIPAGMQVSLFEQHDGYRYQVTATNTPGGHVQHLEARHRVHARVENSVRTAKATGLRRLPSKSWDINHAWCQVVALAVNLLAWLRHLALDGALARAEPKTLRYRLLHTAARLTHGQRQRWLNIPPHWPWVTTLTSAFTRVMALQAPTCPRPPRPHDPRKEPPTGPWNRRPARGQPPPTQQPKSKIN